MLYKLDTLEPWDPSQPMDRVADTAVLHYFDDRPDEQIKVDPYTFKVRHPPNIEDLWSDEELAAAGLGKLVPFQVPDGKQTVPGTRTLERVGDQVVETWGVTDAPPPPTPEQKLEKFAAGMGLTLDELKQVLAEP